MNHKLRTFLVAYLLGAFAAPFIRAQDILPADNKIDWSFAGVPGGIPARSTIYKTLSAGSSTSTIQSALDSCPNGQVVLLAAGNFNNLGALKMSRDGVTLRGATDSNGMPATTLNFSSGSWGLIDISKSGYPQNNYGNCPSKDASGVAPGATSVTLSGAPSGLAVGQIAVFDQTDDGNNVSGQGTEGFSLTRGNNRSLIQVVRIKAITGSKVDFEPGLYSKWWSQSRSPQLYWFGSGTSQFVSNSGVENIKIIRSQSAGGTNNISIGPAYACWVKNVYSQQASAAHVKLGWCLNCEVRDSYLTVFDNVGSAAYCVWSIFSSSDRVENNIMYDSPCALGLQCTSGEVISYNYGEKFPYSQSNWLPECMMTHGGHNANVLFEGNFIPSFWSDFIHGNASFNSYVRNRVTGWEQGKTDSTRCINVEEKQWNLAVLGNVLGTSGYHNTYWDDTGRSYTVIFNVSSDSKPSMTVKGNYNVVDKGVPSSESLSGKTVAVSYVYSSKPDWFGNLPWPWVDAGKYDQANNPTANQPAGYRFKNGRAPSGGGGPTPTPQPTSTPQPTATPAPTATPQPTPTPPVTYNQWIQRQNDWTKANPPVPDSQMTQEEVAPDPDRDQPNGPNRMPQ